MSPTTTAKRWDKAGFLVGTRVKTSLKFSKSINLGGGDDIRKIF